jgi:hypothetical protein
MQQHPINNSFSKIFKYLLFRLQTSLKFQKTKKKQKARSGFTAHSLAQRKVKMSWVAVDKYCFRV